MRKLIALSLLLMTSAFATSSVDEFYEAQENEYAHIWRDIWTEDYGMAMYHLNSMRTYTTEDEIHCLLMKLYIETKRHDKAAREGIMDDIDEIVEEEYMD